MLDKTLFLTSLYATMIIGSINRQITSIEEKNEAIIPQTTQSPPEGNTTFMRGSAWCVALSGASEMELQTALDWACGTGNADCGPIQVGEPCFEPVTLVSHASYAFNSYYQQNGNNQVACNFGGTATLTYKDPSYDKCVYSSLRTPKSASQKWGTNIITSTLLIVYLGIWLLH